jgi:hypothetical protein
MASDSHDAPRHAGQVVRRVLLRRNIAIDAETAQLVAAAVQAALQASAPCAHGRPRAVCRRPGPRPSRRRILAGQRRNIPGMYLWRTRLDPADAFAVNGAARPDLPHAQRKRGGGNTVMALPIKLPAG